MFATDEVIKGGISGYFFKHFEIAGYSALLVAAEAVSDLEGALVFRKIKVQEEEMAKWLDENLLVVTKKYLTVVDTPVTDASR